METLANDHPVYKAAMPLGSYLALGGVPAGRGAMTLAPPLAAAAAWRAPGAAHNEASNWAHVPHDHWLSERQQYTLLFFWLDSSCSRDSLIDISTWYDLTFVAA